MTRFMLDTNACIQIIRGHSVPLHSHLKDISPEELAICSIVWAELLMGARLSPGSYEHEKTKLVPFLDLAQLPFDQDAAEHYAEIRTHLQKSGQLIGERDLMIAAIARAHGLIVITHNRRDFERIPGLEIEDWELP